MHSNKLWVYKDIDESDVEGLSAEAGISRLLAKIFLTRGIKEYNRIKEFLNPSLDRLYDPFLLKDMDKAVERILDAVRSGEKVVIYGDYDVDGVTSTSILYDFLKGLEVEVDFYIPDRLEEGYGLTIAAIRKILDRGAELVITVDCGITANEEVAFLSENGIDTIITDHHECKENVPAACAVINPCRPDCTYPFKLLAGVGVVYKLICALCSRLGLEEVPGKYLDLVAAGTVADVVDLVDENRIIVWHGLEMIKMTRRTGLKALIEVSGLKDKVITSWSISFVLAPRINAAGRVGDAGRAVRLFTTQDADEAVKLALELNEENKYRQEAEMEIFNQAVDKIEQDSEYHDQKVLVVPGEGWHHGVVGIVASKISEKYNKPTILISTEKELGKGSGRSLGGFNLFKALCTCEQYLERYGGHELAAGLSLQAAQIPEFRKVINEYANEVISEEDLIPRVLIDVKLDSEDVTLDNIRELELLAPYGAGNPSPVFSYNGMKIQDIKTVGGDKHLKLRLQDEYLAVDAIGFNMGSMCNTFTETDLLDVACCLEVNTWNSTERVQFNLKGIRLNEKIQARNRYFYTLDKSIVFGETNDYNKYIGIEGAPLKGIGELVPERDDLVAVYQYIKAAGGDRLQIDDLFAFSGRISRSYRIQLNYFKLKKCIEIFEELGLLAREPFGSYGMIIEMKKNIRGKTNLEKSVLYRKLQHLKTQYRQAK